MLSARLPSLPPHRFTGRFAAAGYLIGIGLGGFFDGILLHQVLQWHHLLSLVENPAVQDIRVQILADGLFHVLMNIVAVAGLALLWKSREEFTQHGAGRWLAGTGLLGFGLWNVADVGIFHWILRIHRIRVDVADPLVWDLGWLMLFGILFLIAGWMMRSRSGTGGGYTIIRTDTVASLVIAGVLTAGTVAALPPPASGTALVMFRPGITPNAVFQAFDAAHARVLWGDRSGTVWLVRTPDAPYLWALYGHGAVLVSTSSVGMGCFSWMRM